VKYGMEKKKKNNYVKYRKENGKRNIRKENRRWEMGKKEKWKWKKENGNAK
jgi:hypothetical protein